MLYKIIYAAIAIIGTVYVTTAIFQFFGIGVETYGIYLMFLIGVTLLYVILPNKRGLLFNPN